MDLQAYLILVRQCCPTWCYIKRTKSIQRSMRFLRRELITTRMPSCQSCCHFPSRRTVLPEHLPVWAVKASSQFRFSDKLNRVPAILLKLLDLPNHVCCPKRASIAAALFETNARCMQFQYRHTDMTAKLKMHFLSQWRQVASDGSIPPVLYCALLVVRAKWDVDTRFGRCS